MSIKALQAAGNAPKNSRCYRPMGLIGQISKAIPDGAPSVKEVWERETGTEIDIIGAPAEDIFKKVMRERPFFPV